MKTRTKLAALLFALPSASALGEQFRCESAQIITDNKSYTMSYFVDTDKKTVTDAKTGESLVVVPRVSSLAWGNRYGAFKSFIYFSIKDILKNQNREGALDDYYGVIFFRPRELWLAKDILIGISSPSVSPEWSSMQLNAATQLEPSKQAYFLTSLKDDYFIVTRCDDTENLK